MRAAFGTVGRLAPGMAAKWAEALFCRPPRPTPRPHEETFLASGVPLAIGEGDDRLAAWQWGETGPLAILVHGWGSRAGRFYALAPALVSAGFRVVAFDGPAHGATPGSRATLPEFARALRRVADLLGPVRVAAGHSLGGAAIAIAVDRGLPLERAALIAAPADAARYSALLAERFGMPARVHDAMRRNLETRLQMRFEEVAVPRIAQRQRLPLLVVHDRDDPDVPFTDAEAIAGAWGGAELHATAGLGHRAIIRDPSVIQRVTEFLAR